MSTLMKSRWWEEETYTVKNGVYRHTFRGALTATKTKLPRGVNLHPYEVYPHTLTVHLHTLMVFGHTTNGACTHS